jgi:MscS family membrane protein
MDLIPDSAVPAAPPGNLLRLVNWVQSRFFPGAMDNATARWIACGLILIGAILLRRLIARLIFVPLKKLSARMNNKLLMPRLEGPTATMVMLCGIIAALTVVPLWDTVPNVIWLGERGALTAVILWGVACAGGAVIDHFADGARSRQLHVAAFVPLMKSTAAAFFAVFSVLVVCESLGFEVKTFLAGLGIGGLAFALAAQDTLANLFGSFVVVIDQPFYVGESIRVASFEGTVEEIGLRSTRLRTGQRTQIVIPNKTVATEVITNLTRMPQRRVDLSIGINYDTPIDRITAVLEDTRSLLCADPGVHKGQIVASLADLADSSLRIQVLYFTSDPDWESHMAVRERINIAILRAFAAREVPFAYPTSVTHLDGPVARQLAGGFPPNPASGGSASR